MKSDISVIIPSFNTAALLLECIEEIHSRPWHARFEIIVPDSASHDSSVEAVRQQFPGVTIVELPENRGYGAACNAAARCASGGILLFLNSDTRMLAGTLDEIVGAFHADHEIAAVSCHEIAPSGKTVRSCCSHHTLRSGISFLSGYRLFRREGNRYLIADWNRESDRWVDNVSGFAWAIRRELFQQIGGFDEQPFLYFEEQDVSLRLAQDDHRIRFLSRARVVHIGARSSQWIGPWGRRRQWLRSFIYLRRKHGLSHSAVVDYLLLYPFLVLWWLGHLLKRSDK